MPTPGLHKHIHTSACEPDNVHTQGVGGREVGREGKGESFPEDSDAHPG